MYIAWKESRASSCVNICLSRVMPGQLENMQCIVNVLKTSSFNLSLHKTQIVPLLEGGTAFL